MLCLTTKHQRRRFQPTTSSCLKAHHRTRPGYLCSVLNSPQVLADTRIRIPSEHPHTARKEPPHRRRKGRDKGKEDQRRKRRKEMGPHFVRGRGGPSCVSVPEIGRQVSITLAPPNTGRNRCEKEEKVKRKIQGGTIPFIIPKESEQSRNLPPKMKAVVISRS
jgi:hypothetical protein